MSVFIVQPVFINQTVGPTHFNVISSWYDYILTHPLPEQLQMNLPMPCFPHTLSWKELLLCY